MAHIDIRQSGALFSIGQMAELFNMNIRTLRYYDQIRLLEPEYVNPETNYRYYSSAQFERLNTIKYLRALDVPIERIARFFEGRDVELMRGIFEDQLAEVRAKQRELKRIERKIKNRIAQIDQAVAGPLGVVEDRQLPERRVVSLAESFAPSADLEPLIRDLSRRTRLDDEIFLGKVGVSISREDLIVRAFDQLSSVFILLEAWEGRREGSVVLAAGTYACIRYRGTHKDAAPYYSRLVDHIEACGAVVAGDSVETTIIDAGMTVDEAQYVTELQIPYETTVHREESMHHSLKTKGNNQVIP